MKRYKWYNHSLLILSKGAAMRPNQIVVEETCTGIGRAVRLAGSQALLADTLGVSQQAVSAWLKQGWVPHLRAVEIETKFGVPRVFLVNPQIVELLEPPSFQALVPHAGLNDEGEMQHE